MLLTFIKLPVVIKIFILPIFEWPFYTGFTVYCCILLDQVKIVIKVELTTVALQNILKIN